MGSGRTIYQVNLAELVEDYTWDCYKHDKGFFKGLFLRRSNYYFDIRWGYVDFKHVGKPDVKKREVCEEPNRVENCTHELSTEKDVSSMDGQLSDMISTSDAKLVKKDIELYFSEYENKTDIPQKYTFAASRATTSSTKFELQESYTLGATTNLEINLAEIVKIGANVNGEFSVTETKAEEFTKSLSWNIDTEIEVSSWHQVKASLYVCEIPTKSNFVVQTTVSLPTGHLPVTIRRVKDGKEVHTEWINDLEVLFVDDYLDRSSVEIIPKKVVLRNGDEIMDNQVVLTTRGVCKNISFINQHIKVECKKIEDDPISKAERCQKEMTAPKLEADDKDQKGISTEPSEDENQDIF